MLSVASLKMFQSVESRQPCRLACALSVQVSTVLIVTGLALSLLVYAGLSITFTFRAFSRRFSRHKDRTEELLLGGQICQNVVMV